VALELCLRKVKGPVRPKLDKTPLISAQTAEKKLLLLLEADFIASGLTNSCHLMASTKKHKVKTAFNTHRHDLQNSGQYAAEFFIVLSIISSL
jgi:hypothetical protein